MLRYFCPVILSGGLSSRFGFNKAFLKIKSTFLLDSRIYFFFDLGFIDIYISGYIRGYSYVSDYFLSKGPVFSIFKMCIYFFDSYFTHFIFFPVDLNFSCKKKFFLMLYRCNIFFSYYVCSYFLPFLLSFSLQIYYNLLFFILDLNFYFLSLQFFLSFIFLENVKAYKFSAINFLNFNNYYNYFLLN